MEVTRSLPKLIDERGFEILKFLASHPTSSMGEVARALHYRAETVSSHIRSMKERGLYNGTMGLLCYQKLDMAYVPVLVRAPLANLQTVYEVCRAHPYIEYSVRTLGATDGAFLIFTPPRQGVPLLAKFLDELAADGIISDYRIFVSYDSRRDFLNADLRIFSPQTGVWEFNWNKWHDADMDREQSTNGGRLQTLLVEPELHKLEKSDIELLRIVSDDAKLPTEEISRTTSLPPYTVRRRIQSLEENGFIIGYRAMISYSKFHLSSSMIFNCNAPQSEVEICKQRLLTLPFPGTFIPVQNGFLCQATLPPEGLPPVHRFLAQRCNNVEVSWFDLPTSDVAVLNSEAYSESGWRNDPTFLIDEPLRALGKKH
jgi:DNA-binding Lrp family transcriptional regulator